jgi:hypothetical protein
VEEEIKEIETKPEIPVEPIENSENGIAFVNNNQNGMGNIVSPQP